MQYEECCESSCEIALLFALIELIKITYCITSIQNQIYYWLPIDFSEWIDYEHCKTFLIIEVVW